ncbi:MAG: PssD/Cps14F family polysaccharide biosynthesis glycosyltransferase [Candidatus Aminicenantia bacterium]
MTNLPFDMKICLVCSAGGHFFELYSLRSLWSNYDHFWVTSQEKNTQYLLRKEKVYWAYFPTNRSIKNFIRNLLLALRILPKEKPKAIISTGAGVGVPFLYLGKILGIKTIYIESMARTENLSLTGRLVYPVVQNFFVQWPELAAKYPRAEFKGQVL